MKTNKRKRKRKQANVQTCTCTHTHTHTQNVASVIMIDPTNFLMNQSDCVILLVTKWLATNLRHNRLRILAKLGQRRKYNLLLIIFCCDLYFSLRSLSYNILLWSSPLQNILPSHLSLPCSLL